MGDYSFEKIIDKLSKFTNADAFICADSYNDTYFMTPRPAVIPGMMINGSLGNKIKNYIQNGVTVKADFYLNTKELSVESYNVIGTIPGEVDDIVFIGAHYDSMWCQGACDDSCSVSVVWTIAKYFSDNEITPYYTLKFAAWAGEEYNRLGSEHYIANKAEGQNIVHYINCGAFG